MNNGFYEFSRGKQTTATAATNGLTVTGSVNITGSLIMSPSSSFILPQVAATTPEIGSAYWSESFLFVYNGTRYMSASFF